MLISIIIPIYNSEKYLEECLNSVLNQTYKNIEVLLINDGSTDESKKICEEYCKKYSNIKLINNINEGVSKARNKGLKLAKGEYVFFCDSDDIMHPRQLEKLSTNLKSTNSELSVCSFSEFVNNVEFEKNKNFKLEEILNKDKMLETIISDRKYSGFLWNKLFKLDIIKMKSHLFFDEKISINEDQIFILEYIIRIKKMCITDEKLYNYRQNPSSVLHKKFSDNKITAILAREKIYNLCKKITINEKINEKNWNILMQTYVYIYVRLFFKKARNRKYWKRLIEEKIQEYRYKYTKLDKSWTKYAKIYYFLLKIYFYLIKRRTN
jgi:glycosyltransferase involved in cell wall biosynthesis